GHKPRASFPRRSSRYHRECPRLAKPFPILRSQQRYFRRRDNTPAEGLAAASRQPLSKGPILLRTPPVFSLSSEGIAAAHREARSPSKKTCRYSNKNVSSGDIAEPLPGWASRGIV